MALTAAIESAVRRNSYNYRPSVNEDHFEWKKLLIKHSISIPTSIDLFVKDVGILKKELKKVFGTESTARLSHAQKSLSVFLKYLWCYGLAPMPPACPIDRVILSIARQYNETIAIRNWTLLDDINKYHQIIKALVIWADQVLLAEKELNYWNNI